MTRIPVFSSQHLEAACRVLADTERGLSGTQIERLLQEIEVADTSPGMTKWKRLFNALAGAQNHHQIGNHLIMFINRAMNPVNYARDPATFAWRRDELNVVLAFSGFYVRDDGKVGYADKATTLDAARARAGRLKAALECRVVHAEVLNYCRAELLDENYFHAVFEATKGVAERIRLLSGLNGDGADLVNKTFRASSPFLPYRRSVMLASGRYAMLDDGMGFSLVPWKPLIERRLGQQLAATVCDGGVSWEIGRRLGPV